MIRIEIRDIPARNYMLRLINTDTSNCYEVDVRLDELEDILCIIERINILLDGGGQSLDSLEVLREVKDEVKTMEEKENV